MGFEWFFFAAAELICGTQRIAIAIAEYRRIAKPTLCSFVESGVFTEESLGEKQPAVDFYCHQQVG